MRIRFFMTPLHDPRTRTSSVRQVIVESRDISQILLCTKSSCYDKSLPTIPTFHHSVSLDKELIK